MLEHISLLAQFATEAVEEKSGLAVLGIDPKAILLQAGTFLLLFLIIRKYALQRIINTLESRRRTIEEGLTNAEKLQRMVEKTAEEQEKILAKTRLEADKILEKAQQEAGVIVKESEELAELRAAKLLDETRARIEQEVVQAKAALKKEMLQLVANAAELILEEKLDPKKDSALIERALREAA